MGEDYIQYRDMHSIILEKAERLGEKNYIISVDQGKEMTFSQINHFSNKVANFLKEKGFKNDDRVSLIGNNSIEIMIIFFGVLRYGAIISPLNVEESEENIYRMIKRVRPKLILYDKGLSFDSSSTADSWIPFSDFDGEEQPAGSFFSLIEHCDSDFRTPVGNRDDIAEIIFTSGTEKNPKGVVYSREGLFYIAEEVIDKIGMTEEDKILEYRAYSWASPQTLSIFPTMHSGATLVFPKKFSRSRFPIWLKENNVTISAGVPTVINMLVNEPVDLHQRDVPALKFMTSSSAPLSAEMHHAFEKIYGISINQMGGQTECGWMFGNPPDKRKEGSVGTTLKYKDMRIVDDHGRECRAGEVGELMIRGKSVGIGYLNESGGVAGFPREGIPTGDLGYKDSDGYVFLTGRKKDLIIRGGINISPQEITDRLMEHPLVKEAVTFGIPDRIYGEEVASLIVPKPGSRITDQGIQTHCKETLPDFKIPKEITFVEEIPKTKRGKVAKDALISIFERKRS